MEIKRHFLGWDGPIVEKVGAWLLRGKTGSGPVDFSDTLIVAPTLQAGRRLREVLALRCHERRSALLSATIVTPRYFFVHPPPGAKTANPALVRAVWTEVLEAADPGKFSAFFPGPQRLAGIDRYRWALATGEIIERLRQELADGGYGIQDVISRHANDLQELDRWKNLARLEEFYLRKISELGFADSCVVKMGLADQPGLEPGVVRIVVACVPDPTLLAVRALENLARDHAVDILVHAPAEADGKFDGWGRPVADEWAGEEVDLPAWDSSVFLEASPDTQARRVAGILAGLPADCGPADIGIGVPDPAVIPFLERELLALGLPAFDPADAPFSGHTLGRLIEGLAGILQSRAYVHVADLLRHPVFLDYLCAAGKIEPGRLLAQLDEFQNYYLPVSLDGLRAPFADSARGSADQRHDFSTLGKALKVLQGQVDEFGARPPEAAWRLFLQSVYGDRVLGRDDPADLEFEQAAAIVEETFRELREIPRAKLGLDQGRYHDFFVRRLRERSYSRERAAAALDLQGWLELPWTDAPVLVVAGMNEEFVPGGSLGGVFLPDSLRKLLGLRDDRSRFGRDVFLLKGLVESRRRGGRLCVIAGKYTLSGDPLRPSRLLFRCGADRLTARARQLFQPVEQAGRLAAAATIFRLRPAAAEPRKKILEEKIIAVTALGDYLVCPFRFYLKHVLGMEALADDRGELDPFDFGSFVHEVLKAMGEDRELWNCRDALRLGGRLAELVDELAAARFGKIAPPGALVALSSARARLRALAGAQVAIAGAGWEIIKVEQTVSMSRNGFTITGKIDRIDRHRDSGALRIIDYKTADGDEDPRGAHLRPRREAAADYNRLVLEGKPGKQGKARSGEMRWHNLQLPLYRLLGANLQPEDGGPAAGVELAYFNLPKAVGGTGLKPWSEFDGAMLDSAARCLDGVLADIAARKFWPPAASVEHDREFEMLFLAAPEKAFDLTGFPP